MIRAPLCIAVFIFAVSTFAGTPDKTKIEWHPKAGDHDDYRFEFNCPVLHAPDQDHELKIHMDLTTTTKDVEKNGDIVVEEKFSAFKMIMDGTEAQADDSNPMPKDFAFKSTFKKTGEIVAMTPAAGYTPPNDVQGPSPFDAPGMIYPAKPVGVGDTWKVELNGDPAKKTYDTEVTYTFKGSEEMDGFACYRIDILDTNNGPGNAITTGSYWVAQDDGALIKGHFDLKNFSIGEGSPPANGELTLEIKSQS
jgi:hypothetical protein